MEKYVSIFENKKYSINGVLIIFIMCLMMMHDYIFNFLLYGTPLYYFAGWKDALVIVFLLYITLKILKSVTRAGVITRINYLYIKIILLFIFVLFMGIHEGSLENFGNFRFYFLLIFFSIFLSSMLVKDFSYNLKFYERGLVLSTLLTVFYGYYQYLTIEKPEDFWYWNHFVSLGYAQHEWNAIRNGLPRVSSFFTSSLDYSLSLAINFSLLLGLLYFNIVNKNRLKVILYFIFLLVVFHSIYISTVRSGLIGIAGIMMMFISFYFFRRKIFLYWYSIFIFFSMTFATFIYIIFGYTDDLSALGRIPQWLNFFDLIKGNLSFGLGIGQVGIKGSYWSDSFWINLFLSFGLMGGLIIVIFILKIYFLILKFILVDKNKKSLILYFPLFMLMPVLFYLFIFQSFSRTSSLFLIIALIFIFIFDNLNLQNVNTTDKIQRGAKC